MIPEIANLLLESLPVVGGVAIVENQHDDTAIVEGVPPSGFLGREAELLETAYDIMPTLPFRQLDVLILDAQGKDISGQGMDTNVIGRRPFAINEPEPEHPSIKRIYTRSLSETTHGNAMGVGSADFVHRNIATDIAAENNTHQCDHREYNTRCTSSAGGRNRPSGLDGRTLNYWNSGSCQGTDYTGT